MHRFSTSRSSEASALLSSFLNEQQSNEEKSSTPDSPDSAVSGMGCSSDYEGEDFFQDSMSPFGMLHASSPSPTLDCINNTNFYQMSCLKTEKPSDYYGLNLSDNSDKVTKGDDRQEAKTPRLARLTARTDLHREGNVY